MYVFSRRVLRRSCCLPLIVWAAWMLGPVAAYGQPGSPPPSEVEPSPQPSAAEISPILPTSAIEDVEEEEQDEPPQNSETLAGEAQQTADGLIQESLDLTELPWDGTPSSAGTTLDVGDAEIRGRVREIVASVLPENVQPSTFNGIQPGKSTEEDVKQAWGEADDVVRHEKTTTSTYSVPPFRRVDVDVVDGRVQTILVHLEKPAPVDQLAEQLQLSKLRSTEVLDEEGKAVGRAFPERGALFSYQPDEKEPLVSHLVLEQIDPQPFVVRAESQLLELLQSNLADLNYAIQLDSKYAYPYWLRARILLEVGQLEAATKSAEMAVKLEPKRAEFRLTKARCMARQGLYEDAIRETSQAIQQEDIAAVFKARGLTQLGTFVADGPKRDYKQSVKLYLEAIKVADSLVTDPRVEVRRAAKEILVDAHLGAARSIGWGSWKRKPEVVPKWVDRAAAAAEELISDGGSKELRLRVAERALAAGAGFNMTADPAQWVDQAQKEGLALIQKSADPLFRQHIRWELGRAYLNALQVEHNRGNADPALQYGRLAQRHLEAVAGDRTKSLDARYTLGWLYFRIGALHALHRKNNETAVVWYDMAVSMLSPRATSGASYPGRLGEAMVSMAVSYWQIGLKQKAMELTKNGAKLIEDAVQQGAAPKSALAIPYGNLATMHQQLGNKEQAASFTELVDKNQPAKQ